MFNDSSLDHANISTIFVSYNCVHSLYIHSLEYHFKAQDEVYIQKSFIAVCSPTIYCIYGGSKIMSLLKYEPYKWSVIGSDFGLCTV